MSFQTGKRFHLGVVQPSETDSNVYLLKFEIVTVFGEETSMLGTNTRLLNDISVHIYQETVLFR